jgi:hypothetical protein
MNNQNIKNITHPKLLVFLLVLLFIPIALFTYNKYKDWDNAKLIKGLHKDFPVLVSEIEQATGLELEQKVDCTITSEKFSNGVRTCELSVGNVGLNDAEKKVMPVFNDKKSNKFLISSGVGGKEGFDINYMDKNTCQVWFASTDRLHLSCIAAVREANIDLARELFINN